jgi:hypothetical protein
MRILFLTLAILVLGSAAEPAKADPYRWCANYSGRSSAQNCGFLTIEQCRAAISGNGGWCVPNPFFDGAPIVTPEDGLRYQRRRR